MNTKNKKKSLHASYYIMKSTRPCIFQTMIYASLFISGHACLPDDVAKFSTGFRYDEKV